MDDTKFQRISVADPEVHWMGGANRSSVEGARTEAPKGRRVGGDPLLTGDGPREGAVLPSQNFFANYMSNMLSLVHICVTIILHIFWCI